jgi:hypothetical protein
MRRRHRQVWLLIIKSTSRVGYCKNITYVFTGRRYFTKNIQKIHAFQGRDRSIRAICNFSRNDFIQLFMWWTMRQKMPSALGDALWWSVSVEIVGYGDIVLVIAEGRWASF